MAMLILNTRSRDDAERMAAKISKFGIDNIIDPLVENQPIIGWEEEFRKISTKSNQIILLFTSRRAIIEFADKFLLRKIPILVVGNKSKELAIKLGFQKIYVGSGNAASLIRLIKEVGIKNIIYLSGKITTLDFSEAMRGTEYNIINIVVYNMLYKSELSNASLSLLKDGKINAVILCSIKTAKSFLRAILSCINEINIANINLLVLSRKISDYISNYRWKKIYVADTPSEDAIITLIKDNFYEAKKEKS